MRQTKDNEDGDTPINKASKEGRLEIVKYLEKIKKVLFKNIINYVSS